MVVSTIVEAVVVAQLTAEGEGAVEERPHHGVGVLTVRPEHHIDPVSGEYIRRPGAHAAREHRGHSLFSEPHREHAAAVLWRSGLALFSNVLRLVHCEECKGLGAAEVAAESPLANRNCDHHFPCLLPAL